MENSTKNRYRNDFSIEKNSEISDTRLQYYLKTANINLGSTIEHVMKFDSDLEELNLR